MRIGYFGDGVWAQRAFARLIEDPHYTIAFVVVRASRPDTKLVALAEAKGIPVLSPAAVNAPESLAEIAAFAAELHVSMSYDQILRETILTLPPRGTLNCHAGALPFYRGRNPLTWALINGETEFGITVHWVDLGIDTGDIVRQIKVPISATDTYATLLETAETLCADTLIDAISDVYHGSDKRIAQSTIDPVGLYCCRRREGDEEIDWTWSSAALERFVRALVPPGPGARTMGKDGSYAVLAAELIPAARSYIGAPGEVIGRDGGGILVKTGDSFIRITRWAPVGTDGSLGAALVPAAARGSRLGRNLTAALAQAEAKLAALETKLGLGRGD
ncbi:methionyl-tRNA formyltransferase [Bradyrhizobium daqingense]|uniref:Methionyl-tRNA formyltransferase n=1 Tax=Bradyrhizobium daqingense TaxID=993502 RepID=A0A562LQM9_9BRAD|nr:methionyl-tRNA formyltransferase [Bradyrhizobium daqingense]TWI09883.1 methionyl-tRNA formyltransferase [Bradyrhizobium daqingense]UFS88199.1 methionyl-tRNA formyltransferase [Bradyrhizobium daqingense]